MDTDTTIGHYKILRPLGKGGMGEVYLAEDTRLKREVALKVLPESVRSDPERLRRFRTEAEAAAKLNYPNIATIYSIEEAEGQTFITMEYVDGKTLHIPEHGLDIEQFFTWFVPLADALSHAHEHGRIHRDLKPANIMIREDGTPKILDFGLARIERGEPVPLDSDMPTRTADEQPLSLTQGKGFMGTPSYMSPEQIEGKKVDARSDLFSFGIVMYEALTGQRPFKGDNIESIIGRILAENPRSVSDLKPMTPHTLGWTVRKCLHKKREQRIQSSRELHSDMLDIQREIQAGAILVDASTVQVKTVPLWHQSGFIVTGVLLLMIGILGAWLLKPVPEIPGPRLRKFAISVETVMNSDYDRPAISPDGRMIVYAQGIWPNTTLWIRDLAAVAPRELTGTKGGIRPFWSPGSDYVAYFNVARSISLQKISVSGGTSIRLCELPKLSRGGAWREDGTIIFGADNSLNGTDAMLYTVSAQGGEPRIFAVADSTLDQRGLMYPITLPEGVLMYVATVGDNAGAIMVQDEQEGRVLLDSRDERVAFPAYSPTGHIVYQLGFPESKGVWAVPFDGVKVTGEPFPVDAYGGSPSVSSDGTLAYRFSKAAGTQPGRLVWLDRHGQEEPVGDLKEGLYGFRLSPDNKQVAFTLSNQGNQNMWMYDLVRDIPARFTFDPGLHSTPVWSPDGQWIAFASGDAGDEISVKPADGSGDAAVFAVGGQARPNTWSPDGRYLVYDLFSGDSTRYDLWSATLTEADGITIASSLQPFLRTPFNEISASLSPDGQYLAYASDESGQPEVYVVSFPDGGNKRQVSANGGNYPEWHPKGGELFYWVRQPDGTGFMMAVSVETRGRLSPGRPHKLFKAPQGALMRFSVSSDGQRFLTIKLDETSAVPPTTVTVVENWIKEFEGRE